MTDCICPRFRDTGGYRIADLTCLIHGVNGTDPGDGYWADDKESNVSVSDVPCVLCGGRVNWHARDGSVLRQIDGWEEPREQGGANKIIGRRETGLWAHTVCWQAQQTSDQVPLWGDAGSVTH